MKEVVAPLTQVADALADTQPLSDDAHTAAAEPEAKDDAAPSPAMVEPMDGAVMVEDKASGDMPAAIDDVVSEAVIPEVVEDTPDGALLHPFASVFFATLFYSFATMSDFVLNVFASRRCA